MEAVGGVTQLITELVDNAIAFSAPREKATITGVFDRDDYILSISDHGVGIPPTLLAALNRVLDDPASVRPEAGTSLGIVVVARIAARHGINVQLVPSVPGTTARITIGSRTVTAPDAPTSVEQTAEDSTGTILESRYAPGHVVAMNESARREAEVFLERVFGPLRGHTASRRPAKTRSNGNGQGSSVRSAGSGTPDSPQELSSESAGELETRVPGTNFSVDDDDPSVISGEGAVDIRLNLNRYEEGRQQATDGDDV
jgi:hypothetical protein